MIRRKERQPPEVKCPLPSSPRTSLPISASLSLLTFPAEHKPRLLSSLLLSLCVSEGVFLVCCVLCVDLVVFKVRFSLHVRRQRLCRPYKYYGGVHTKQGAYILNASTIIA